MKRSFQDDGLTMANCLMFLSQGRQTLSLVNHNASYSLFNSSSTTSSTRIFECKTCNRQFHSFQALGGHRASHRKPRLMGVEGSSLSSETRSLSPVKPKTHECSICGLEFAIGQALGGHMRRHRAVFSDLHKAEMMLKPTPVVKKSNSRRVLCLDLNLTPNENDLELFNMGKTTQMVNCFF